MARRTMLSQALRERHVNMMAFSATIGFGIFLQAGKIINLAGPGLALVCFVLACSVMWAVIACLGEMTALFPVPGPLMEFPGRFLDEAVGYACAWMAWATWVIIMAAEILAVSQLWQFQYDAGYLASVGYPDTSLEWSTANVSPAIWVTVSLGIIGLVNLLPVKYGLHDKNPDLLGTEADWPRYFGELEYVFGCLKMIFFTIVILFCIVVNAVQPLQHMNHFWTWAWPWGFSSRGFVLHNEPLSVITGDLGHFLSLWSGITSIVFSITGFESIAISAPENADLTKFEIVKLATRKLSIRITILYIMCAFVGGLNVPYDDPNLTAIQDSIVISGANSIFVLTAVRNHLRGWPSFFNGFFIFSATSCAINGLYISSRMLHALASISEAWPRFAQGFRKRLEETSRYGVPYNTILISWMFGFLGYLSMRSYPSIILGRMATNAVVSDLIVYAIICLSYTVFFRKIRANAEDEELSTSYAYDRDHNSYPYRTHLQVFRAWYGFTFCILLIIFNGWRSFVTPFGLGDFVASYISIPIFVLIICAYHVQSDGWNPLKWRRRASYELRRPAPKVTVAPRRRGLWPRHEKGETTNHRVIRVLEWVWIWLK